METLTSARNPALKEIRKAILNGTLTGQGFCVAEGLHLLEEAVRSGCQIEAIFVSEAAADSVERRLVADKRLEESLRVAVLPGDLFRTIVSTETSQGIVSLVRPPHWTVEQLFGRRSALLVLDGIQDPGNAGAMIRAAEAFGATGVAMLKGSVNPYNPKALRASAGSAFRVPLVSGLEPETLLPELEIRGIPLIALMPASPRFLDGYPLNRECAVIIGSEGHGVREDLRQKTIGLRIPTLGVESLNAAMAATVLLYEAHRQRR